MSSNDFKLTTKLNRQTLETFSSTMLPQPCHCFQRKIIPIQNSPAYALFYKMKTGPVIGKKCQGTHMGKKEKDKKEVILFFPQKEMSLKCLSHRQSTQNVLLLSQWLNVGVFMHSQLLRNLRLNPQTAFSDQSEQAGPFRMSISGRGWTVA